LTIEYSVFIVTAQTSGLILASTKTSPYTADSYPLKNEESTMHNYPNTGHESPLLDAEDWNIVFQAYTEFPILAFILAQHLHGVKTLIEQGPKGATEAIGGIERAIECLMPHTNFRDAGRTIYMLAVTGTLSAEQEEKLREFGLLE
jgi:hypothetical protein